MKDIQAIRFHALLDYLQSQFKEEINIQKVEEICHYSYRNINRIFQSKHGETIGKYVKRLRLEKAAEYLKYSTFSVTQIAYEVGFSDVAVFSKAFKKYFHATPLAYRKQTTIATHYIDSRALGPIPDYTIEHLPEFEILFIEFKGPYDAEQRINRCWEQLYIFAEQQDLIHEDSIFVASILDDIDISESIYCRYRAGIVIQSLRPIITKGSFRIGTIPSSKYVKFVHQGPQDKSHETYDRLYGHWMNVVQEDFADLPVLEFYLNDEDEVAPEELLTEIYIPIQ